MRVPEIKHNRPLISVQDMVNFIKKGEEYKKSILTDTNNSENFDFLYAIILTPDYQREYRSSRQEESSIIESLILGIPIPEVFLVKTSDNIQLRHVMDGQHRLNAIYRFINGKFALKNLELLDADEEGNRVINPEFEGKYFKDLDSNHKIKILGSHISVLEFDSMDNPDFEIELFKRYNRNSKPLENQEISMATYFSKTSQFISKFISTCFDYSEEDPIKEYTEYEFNQLKKIYNITSIRREKQKNHQEICILLNIIENGPNLPEVSKDGVKIATDYLKNKSVLYKNKNDEELERTRESFRLFNSFIFNLMKTIEYPISTEIINKGIHKAPKYHVGISITLATIFYLYDIDIENENLFNDVNKIIRNSPTGDSEFRASTTQLKTLIRYLFIENEIQNMTFDSMVIRPEKLKQILS